VPPASEMEEGFIVTSGVFVRSTSVVMKWIASWSPWTCASVSHILKGDVNRLRAFHVLRAAGIVAGVAGCAPDVRIFGGTGSSTGVGAGGSAPARGPAVPSPSPSEAWPQIAHDAAHTGRSTAIVGGAPAIVWSAPAPEPPNALVVDAMGDVYAASFQVLAAFDSTGATRWSMSGYFFGAGVAPDGTIVVTGAEQPDQNGFVRGYAPDGTQRFAVPNLGGMTTEPVIASDGTIYVGTQAYGTAGPRLHAFGPDGTLKWAVALGNEPGTPGIDSAGRVIVPLWSYSQTPMNEATVAFDTQGIGLWSTPSDVGGPSMPSIGPDGTLWVVQTSKNHQGAAEPNMMVLSATGAVQTEFQKASVMVPAPEIDLDGNAYLGMASGIGKVTPSGETLWFLAGATPPDQHGHIWRLGALDAIDTVVVVDATGVLFGAADGKKVFEVAGHDFGGPVAIGRDGTIYVGAKTAIYALR